MILKTGDVILVAHRRLFETDRHRFFLGTVETYEGGLAAVNGYTFAREDIDGTFVRKADPVTKIVTLTSGSLMTYRLPPGVVVDDARIIAETGRLILTDGHGLEMNLSEHLLPE
jgi:hypothetical protein